MFAWLQHFVNWGNFLKDESGFSPPRIPKIWRSRTALIPRSRKTTWGSVQLWKAPKNAVRWWRFTRRPVSHQRQLQRKCFSCSRSMISFSVAFLQEEEPSSAEASSSACGLSSTEYRFILLTLPQGWHKSFVSGINIFIVSQKSQSFRKLFCNSWPRGTENERRIRANSGSLLRQVFISFLINWFPWKKSENFHAFLRHEQFAGRWVAYFYKLFEKSISRYDKARYLLLLSWTAHGTNSGPL